MILQTKHEITSIHLNDRLHWLYLASSNNVPLLLPTASFLLLTHPLHPSNLILSAPASSLFLISTLLFRVLYRLLQFYCIFLQTSSRLPKSLTFLVSCTQSASPLWCLMGSVYVLTSDV